MSESAICCPKFSAAAWQERVVVMDKKIFVKARVRSFLHIPLNVAGVLKRQHAAILKAGATVPDGWVLTDENSLWGADYYFEVSREVPTANTVKISGTFLTQAYEGSFRSIPLWIAEIRRRVANRGKTLQGVLFWYTTCPKCAQKSGENWVVLFAKM